MHLILAPMEGLADYWMRRALTDTGAFDACVSEFVRVTSTLLPARVFYRWCPELNEGAQTRNGTPVHLQLLGSDPPCVADNAARAVELGAPVVDLNFGCPAKTVNRHRGGAALLDEPELLEALVSAVRGAVPSEIPVSAKIRLGIHDTARALDNARAVAAGGADWLTVHARTRDQGYRPPAWWEDLPPVRAAAGIPVIGNGDIWSPEDAERCRGVTGCDDLMLGRGAVQDPFLALRLRATDAGAWPEVQALLLDYLDTIAPTGDERHICGRIKQWLNYLRRGWPEAQVLMDDIKRLNSISAIRPALAGGLEKAA